MDLFLCFSGYFVKIGPKFLFGNSSMAILVLGINHKTAAIAVRESLYFPVEKLSLYLQDLMHRGLAREAVLLSTCNRSELYCEADDVQLLKEWLCSQASVDSQELHQAFYHYRDQAAVSHIMQVACGLDSMVLGEQQILGQMKEAFSESCTAGAIDTLFHRLFQQVFALAKEIRTTTAIGACPVSVVSAATRFAKQQLPTLEQARVLIIGAGETAELLLRYLKSYLTQPVAVVNRSREKAEQLLKGWGGKVFEIHELSAALCDADVVFSATGSATPLVSTTHVQAAMARRYNPALMLIDIAVPRDIDPAVAQLAGVRLFCIDDFKEIIEKNRQGREHAAEKAREMIVKKSHAFTAELKSMTKAAYTIRAYRQQIETLCYGELVKAKQRLARNTDAVQVLEDFAYALTKKLLHTPSIQLRQAGAKGREELLHVAKELFALPDAETEWL
jgi:glutamyl-tRNA reductase